MVETFFRTGNGKAPTPVLGVIVPIVLLMVVIAVVAGLVAGGVVQGDAERVGPPPPTTESTILIEP